MEEGPGLLYTALKYGLSFAILSVFLCLTIFILAFPSAYSNFSPRTITTSAFSESSKQNPKRSGYDYFVKHADENGHLAVPTSVQILVLGDIGRSPRMQYHALSIAAHGGIVDLIGYTNSSPHPDILLSPFITIHSIPAFPLPTSSRFLFLLLAPFKLIFQTVTLAFTLLYRLPPSKFLLVQNPPSIPTLLLATFAATIRRTRLVIDWHNFGFSILALRLGTTHPLVRIAKLYEQYVSRGAYAHLCVTNAMAAVLRTWAGITALPLHDRPPEIYQPLTRVQRANFLARLPGTKPYAEEIEAGRCRLVVSATSWTADEDFDVLLDALVTYSTRVSDAKEIAEGAGGGARPQLPMIVAIITGRGPMRDKYLGEIARLTAAGMLEHVVVMSAWLSAEDYATLLGAADLGVSLHTSSSGVDLPMKVVDMFGTGLPVAGWSDFEAWPELVREGDNGRGFTSAKQLAAILQELLGGDAEQLERLRQGAMKECERRWEDEWMPVAGPLFDLT